MHAASLGLLFGIAQHAAAHRWIYTALATHAKLSPLAALASYGVFVLYLALFMAVPAGLWARLGAGKACGSGAGDGWMAAAFLAALLALGEWLRGQLFNGFTALSIAYAWIGTPLDGAISVTGIFGLGLALHFLCFAWVLWLRDWGQGRHRSLLVLAAGLAGMSGLAAWGNTAPGIEAEAASLRYRLIQTGVAQHDKFDPASTSRIVSALADEMTGKPADLIVAPETALPTFLHQLPPGVLGEIQGFASSTGSHLFAGVMQMGHGSDAYNSLIHVRPGSGGIETYRKVGLMAFGEYAPDGLQWFARHLTIPAKDLVPGPLEQAPFVVRGHRIGTLICHEDAVTGTARRWSDNVGLFLNPSNLAWFDGTAAIPQGLAIARARAIETGRPILRVANTGITAHIDHHGKVVAQLAPGGAATLEGEIRPTRGLTPYVRFGDWPVLALITLFLCLAILSRAGAWAPSPRQAGNAR